MVHAGNETAVLLHELLVGYIETRIVVTEPPIHCSGVVVPSNARQNGVRKQNEQEHRHQSTVKVSTQGVKKILGLFFFNGESSGIDVVTKFAAVLHYAIRFLRFGKSRYTNNILELGRTRRQQYCARNGWPTG